ncbi:MAG: TPP-dependent pyruvate/acetoin dehydrogenase alpha subunit [Verrucomicrobiales bacterium]
MESKGKNAVAGQSFSERFIETYRWMLLSRILEDKLRSLYRAGRIVGGVYLGRGQEAFSAAMAVFLNQERGDAYAPLIRDMAGRLAFGEPLLDPIRTYLGSVEGPMRGRDGNIHRGRPRNGLPAMISHLGAMVAVINGMLMAKRFQGKTGFVGGACIGDGGTSTGSFHEALNQAAVEKLPLVVAVADNQFSYSTSKTRQFACENLADRAKGYGIRGHNCDGTDLESCLKTFEEAVDRARSGEGPQLVVGSLLRLSGHGEHDDAWYVPEEIKQSKFGRDCVEVGAQQLLEKNWASQAEMDEWKTEAQQKIDVAVSKAAKEPKPDGAKESWYALSSKHLCEGMPEV